MQHFAHKTFSHGHKYLQHRLVNLSARPRRIYLPVLELLPLPHFMDEVLRNTHEHPLVMIIETTKVQPIGFVESINLAQMRYASNGITTMLEGLTAHKDFSAYKASAQRGKIFMSS